MKTFWRVLAISICGVLVVGLLVQWELSERINQSRRDSDRMTVALIASEQRAEELARSNAILTDTNAIIRYAQAGRDARIAALEAAARRRERHGPTPVFSRP